MKNLFLYIIAAAMLTSGCSATEITAQDTEQKEIPVRVAEVQQLDITNKIELNGQAAPSVQSPLLTAAPLTVEKIHIKAGDAVQSGQLLISLDDTTQQQQLKTAKAAVSQLEQALSKAKQMSVETNLAELERLQQEYNEALARSNALLEGIQSGAVTALDLASSTLELTLIQAQLQAAVGLQQQQPSVSIPQLESQLAQARANLNQAEQALQSVKITSPIDGIVSELNVIENGIAAPGAPLGMVMNLNPIKVVFPVNSYQVSSLQSGDNAEITFDGIEGPFRTIISFVSPSANPQTNMFTVSAEIANPDLAIKAGMKATGVVNIGKIEDAYVIPAAAVLYEEGEPHVYIEKDGKAVKQSIMTGFRYRENIQVTDGLTLDDIVITDGKERLTNGSEISIRNE